MTTRKVILQHPAYKGMVKAVEQLGRTRGVKDIPEPVIYLIDNASSLIRSSIDVLLEPDPMKHAMGIILLLLIESTEERHDNVTGDISKVYDITNDYLHAQALERAHSFASRFRGES